MSTWLMHHGIKGQRWGVRRFQNEDGSLKAAGKARVEGGGDGPPRKLSRKERKAEEKARLQKAVDDAKKKLEEEEKSSAEEEAAFVKKVEDFITKISGIKGKNHGTQMTDEERDLFDEKWSKASKAAAEKAKNATDPKIKEKLMDKYWELQRMYSNVYDD